MISVYQSTITGNKVPTAYVPNQKHEEGPKMGSDNEL